MECRVKKRTLTGGQIAGYSIKFTLYQNSSDFKSVSFFVVDNSLGPNFTRAKLITLFTGSGNSQTISSTNLNFDILQVGTYVNSSDSYVGATSSPIVTIQTATTAYLPLDLGSGSFDFKMNGSGEICNMNTNITSSYSYCNVVFSRPDAKYTGLRITYSQDSEKAYDFGVFSKIDKQLCPFNVLDSTTTSGTNNQNPKNIYTGYGSEVVEHSCRGETGTKTITYNISKLDPGTPHSICVKYIKDSSTNIGTDTFKITKIEFLEDVEYDFHYDTAENYYKLAVNNHGSADAHFEWLYVYIEGSSEIYTQPDEATGVIPSGGHYDFLLPWDPIPEQSGRIFCIFKCNGQYHTIYQ